MDNSDDVEGPFRARRTLLTPGADKLTVALRSIRRSGKEAELEGKPGTTRESALEVERLVNENDLLSGITDGEDGVLWLCGDFGDLVREDELEMTDAESEVLTRGRSFFGRTDCPDAMVLLRVSFPGRSVIVW